jgi:hypothetical protein
MQPHKLAGEGTVASEKAMGSNLEPPNFFSVQRQTRTSFFFLGWDLII